MKSHTGFRLVPTSMTLNDLERRNSPHFAFFHRIRQILGHTIMSVKYCLPVLLLARTITHPASCLTKKYMKLACVFKEHLTSMT